MCLPPEEVLALVEIARAARDTYPPECADEGCLHASCKLARALARLDRSSSDGTADSGASRSGTDTAEEQEG
jgi:hypothetical protein